MKAYHLSVTFLEPLLGTAPLNQTVYSDYIATKKAKEYPDEPLSEGELAEELASLPEDNRGTGFHRDPEGDPIVYDYTWKGFFKEATAMLKLVPDSESKKLSAHKKKIDGLVFVYPRQIPIVLGTPGIITILERPLRAQTMQGERITLTRSEMLPAGSKMEFHIVSLSESTVPQALLKEWMDYGRFKGTGQWRSGGWGTFRYTMEACEIDDVPMPDVDLVAA